MERNNYRIKSLLKIQAVKMGLKNVSKFELLMFPFLRIADQPLVIMKPFEAQKIEQMAVNEIKKCPILFWWRERSQRMRWLLGLL
jgi:hypothetical protein